MKIAFFTDSYEPQINGVVTSINLFVDNLRKDGHEVHIFCPSCKKKDRFTHPYVSKKLKNYPEYRVGLPTLKMIKEIRKINPDVVHLHSPFTMGFMGLSVSKILNIPVVATYHTLLTEYSEYSGFDVKRWIVNDYIKCFLNRASTVIAPSKSVKQMLEENKIRSNIEVLPTPMNYKIRKRKKTRNKKFTILHVGRLCKEKRIEVVLKAFQKVLKDLDSRLILTSEGPYKKKLKEVCSELGISNKVYFTGYVDEDKLLKLYSSADVFVTASDTETQGLTILEAMANGCPVIARNAFGFKDVIKNKQNGILVDTEDEMAESIMLLYRRPEIRNRIVRNGYETAKKFDIEESIKRIEDIYSKAIESNKESRTTFKMLYASYLLTGSLESFAIRSMRLPINSITLLLHINFFRTVLIFDNLYDLARI